jgi:Amt family ammonium transporter
LAIYAFGATYIIFSAVNAWRSMRVTREVELAGLDVPQFGMLAYPEDAVEMLTAGSQAQQRGV